MIVARINYFIEGQGVPDDDFLILSFFLHLLSLSIIAFFKKEELALSPGDELRFP